MRAKATEGAALSAPRLPYAIFRTIKWEQWFLKQDNQHPLRAVGMVAAVLVFVGTAIVRLLAPLM
jgi:hypothetical protein